jgi:hypothetical protein
MPKVKRRCGCVICRFRYEPVDTRAIKTHIRKYGEVPVSPSSSPWKGCEGPNLQLSETDDSSDVGDVDDSDVGDVEGEKVPENGEEKR